MQIYGPSQVHGAQPVGPPHTARVNRPAGPETPGAIRDELEISDAAQLVDRMGDLPEVRWDRVQAIRAEIAEGTYETPAKLDTAIGRLLDEIGS